MAKSSAERQAAYRARRAGHDSRERRINTWVDAEVYRTLDVLSNRYGVTRRAIIELLVAHEDGKLDDLDSKGLLMVASKSEDSTGGLLRNDFVIGVGEKASPRRGSDLKLRRNGLAGEVKSQAAFPSEKISGLQRNDEVLVKSDIEQKAPVAGVKSGAEEVQYGFEF